MEEFAELFEYENEDSEYYEEQEDSEYYGAESTDVPYQEAEQEVEYYADIPQDILLIQRTVVQHRI